MKKEEIHWGDWHRILFGTAPAEFLLEVLLRTAIIYLVLLVVLRVMGKRMGGQLTISELAVMLTLGAIIAVPMQAPEKGLLQGTLALVCALAFQRGINYLGVKNARIERLTQGTESLLVRDGVIRADQLAALKISREQLLGTLRGQNIYNLGEVKSVYLEACGLFSVYKNREPMPGLSLLPPGDDGACEEFSAVSDTLVCHECGNPASANSGSHNACSNCGTSHWIPAVTTKQS
jgi:uncharacterized membrane protein YcaP (DUF421 family)